MKRLFLFFFISLVIVQHHVVYAQYASDALLFGGNNSSFTARSLSVGNSLGALGGDLGAVISNPAGLGIYRRVHIGVSLGGDFDLVQSDFNGNIDRFTRNQVQFGGVGMAFPITKRLPDRWTNLNGMIAYHKTHSFSRDYGFDITSTGSRILSFMDNAQGISIDQLNPFEERLAYDAFLIDLDGSGTNNYVAPVISSDIIQKQQRVQQRGGTNALTFGIGAGYNNKIYIGASLNVSFLRFRDDRYYNETATNDTIPFVSMQFAEFREVDGTSINAHLGLVYRVNKWLRMGFSVKTPFKYRLVESYDTEMQGSVYYFGELKDSTYKPEYIQTFQHDLLTPWQFNASIGFLIKKSGFISLELDYFDYTWSSFTLLEDDKTAANLNYINTVNQSIQDNYRSVFRAKVGFEFGHRSFRFRGGYRFSSSPYTTELAGLTDVRHDISFGIGLRWKHYAADLAVVHSIDDFENIPFYVDPPIQTLNNRNGTQFMISISAYMFRANEG